MPETACEGRVAEILLIRPGDWVPSERMVGERQVIALAARMRLDISPRVGEMSVVWRHRRR